MNRLRFAVAFGLSLAALRAFAQCLVPAPSAPPLPTSAVVSLPADGGCLLDVYAVNNLGISITPSKYPFNGARCTTVRTAVQNAANLDAQVGAGVQP